MTTLITFASGAHRECLITTLPRMRKWAKLWNVGLFPIIADSPPVINGGASCYVKFWIIKEILGYMGEPTPYQMEYGTIEPNELVIWRDCDTVDVNYRAHDPKKIEAQLGDKDIACLFHPDEPTAKKMNCGRHFMNGGFFAFRNTQKMRDYFNAVWQEPAIQLEDLDPTVVITMQKWYMERWKVGTDEMRLSQDVFKGRITAAELDKRHNICWPCPRDPATGLRGDLDGAYVYHWAYEPDKVTVNRRMKTMINELESNPETR